MCHMHQNRSEPEKYSSKEYFVIDELFFSMQGPQ